MHYVFMGVYNLHISLACIYSPKYICSYSSCKPTMIYLITLKNWFESSPFLVKSFGIYDKL